MNRYLYESYKKLGATERLEMESKLKDSPVGLQLLRFLDQCKSPAFKNAEVVSYIYTSQDQGKLDYKVLENRYFKLRKKFIDEFFTESVPVQEQLTEQEKELLRCKELLSGGNKEAAYQKLLQLEKECWQKNIFELLPAIMDQVIFCNQSFNRLDPDSGYYKRYEEAIELQAEINRCILYARKIYEINLKKGIQHARKEFDLLKSLAKKHKEYPRFSMCYHHISLYYKLSSQHYVKEMQVISRHFTEFKKLSAAHPLVPLVAFKSNYNKYQHFHFKQMMVFYHVNRCEFTEAYQAMKELWDLAMSKDTIYGAYRTESMYYNTMNMQVATERFTEAIGTVETYIKFLKENRQPEKLLYAYSQLASIHCDAFPKFRDKDLSFLHSKLDEFIHELEKNDLRAPLGEMMALRSRIYFLGGDRKKAWQLLESEPVKEFYTRFDLYAIYLEFFSEKFGGKSVEDMEEKIRSSRRNAASPSAVLNLNWMLRVCRSLPH